MLSSKYRVLSQIVILTCALLGLWFGSLQLFWPGIIMFLTAFAVFIVMFRRDQHRPTEQEKRLRWKFVQGRGLLAYIRSEVRVSVRMILLLVVIDLLVSYMSRGS